MICDTCGHKFEDFHSMIEPHTTVCPNKKCKKHKVRQSFDTAPHFHNLMSPLHPRKTRGRGH